MPTDLLTTSRKLLMRKATVVSVDKEAATDTDAGGGPAWENIWGKLSRIGNGSRVCDL